VRCERARRDTAVRAWPGRGIPPSRPAPTHRRLALSGRSYVKAIWAKTATDRAGSRPPRSARRRRDARRARVRGVHTQFRHVRKLVDGVQFHPSLKMVSFACEGTGVSCDRDGCHGACSPTVLGLRTSAATFPTVSQTTCLEHADEGFRFGVIVGNTSTTAMGEDHDRRQRHGRAASGVARQGEGNCPRLGPFDTQRGRPGPPRHAGRADPECMAAGGAYELRSDVPLIAYQFNPLESRLAARPLDCPVLPGENGLQLAFGAMLRCFCRLNVLSSSYVVNGYHAWTRDSAQSAWAISSPSRQRRDDTDVEFRFARTRPFSGRPTSPTSHPACPFT